MPDETCKEIRRRLAQGEEHGVAGHLAGCVACRREAELLELVAEALREDAVLSPPGDLDRAVRARIEGASAPGAGAIGAAVAALLALVCGAGAMLAEQGFAERGVWIAGVAAAAYLAVSAAAALPILLRHGAAAPVGRRG